MQIQCQDTILYIRFKKKNTFKLKVSKNGVHTNSKLKPNLA